MIQEGPSNDVRIHGELSILLEDSWFWPCKASRAQDRTQPRRRGALTWSSFCRMADGLGGLLIGILTAMSWDRTPTTIMTYNDMVIQAYNQHILQATYSNCTSKLSVEFAQYTTCIEMYNVITMWFSVLMCKLLCARCATQSQNMKVKAQEWVGSLNVILGVWEWCADHITLSQLSSSLSWFEIKEKWANPIQTQHSRCQMLVVCIYWKVDKRCVMLSPVNIQWLILIESGYTALPPVQSSKVVPKSLKCKGWELWAIYRALCGLLMLIGYS